MPLLDKKGKQKGKSGKGPPINYVVSVGGEEGSPKDSLVDIPYFIKKTTRKGWREKGSKISDFETT